MKYQELSPSQSLQHIISNYWLFEIPENSSEQRLVHHEILPENTVSLVFIDIPHYQGIRILGPQLRKFQQDIMPPSRYLGIRFQPWISVKPLFLDKSSVINQIQDTDSSIASAFSSFFPSAFENGFPEIHLVERALQNYLKTCQIAKSDLVKFICLELQKGKTISEITEEIPLSIRPIQKRFKATTGLTMKQFANVVRMQKTWREMILDKKEFLSVILGNGYYDQSHFINAFQKMMKSSHRDFHAYHSSIDIELF